MLIHAGDDQCVPPGISQKVASRLKAHGKDNYRVHVYPGAGHLIEPPYSPHYKGTYIGSFGEPGKIIYHIINNDNLSTCIDVICGISHVK